MANGKPGDHPLTDILNHGIEVFGPYTDALIREVVVKLGGEEELERRFNLLHLDPRSRSGRSRKELELRAFHAELLSLRDELRARRLDEGWEL